MPLVAQNVECPQCAVPFLAPHRSPSNPVQCPHCGGQQLLSRCREVAPEMLAQRPISTIRTEEEVAAEVLEQSRGQQTKLVLAIAAVIGVLGLGTYAAVTYGFGRNVEKQKQEQALAAQLAAADKARYDEAFQVARRALAEPDWRKMLTKARAHGRALPRAEWVYDRKPYEPMLLTGYQFPQDMHVGEDAFVRLFVSAEGLDAGFWLRLQNSGFGWLLDWEALGYYTREHWNAFVEERPTTVEEYRVHIQRSSVPDRHFYERGYTGEGDAISVRIWSLDASQDVHAIIEEGSAAHRGLVNGIRWEIGEGYIVRLSWPENPVSDGGYEFVELVDVVQPGWHISTVADVAAH